MGGVKVTKGLRRLLERDPVRRIFYDVELVQERANLGVLAKVMTFSKNRVRRGFIHVTDLAVPCDRLLAAAFLGIQPPHAPITPETRRVLDNGIYMHLRYQSYFLCLPKPYAVDVSRVLQRWPLIGEADVLVEHPEWGNWVIELKSINSVAWRSLSAAIPEHRQQLNGYLGLLGGSWKGQIWYENKNDQKVKVFSHELDLALWQEQWTRASRIAWDLTLGRLPGLCDRCVDPLFCESISDKLGRMRWRPQKL